MDFKNMKLSDLTKEQLIDIVEVQKRNLDLQENFLINISHDLRSPVNSILSVLQCLKYLNGDNYKEIKEKTNEYRKIIKRNSLKIIKLIDNLIDTTKLEGESYNLNKTNIDIIKPILEKMRELGYQTPNDIDSIDNAKAILSMCI